MRTATILPAQSTGVPETFKVNVSQLTPSVQVDSSADAPPVGGPSQATGGSLGPIVPDGGAAACDAARGKTKIAAVATASSRRRGAGMHFSMLSSSVRQGAEPPKM